MRVVTYGLEMRDGVNVLVKETSTNYTELNNVNSPRKIHKLFTEVFRLHKKSEEFVYLLGMNTAGKPVGIFPLSHGIINSSFCSTREIFVRLLLCNAQSFVVVHNHPSGDLSPSKNDLDNFQMLKNAGKLMRVECLDSIIVAEYDYLSLMERGLKLCIQ